MNRAQLAKEREAALRRRRLREAERLQEYRGTGRRLTPDEVEVRPWSEGFDPESAKVVSTNLKRGRGRPKKGSS